MTSIPVTISRFSGNNFKRLYIKKEWLFFDFLLHSEMCMKFRTFWKKGDWPSLIIPEIIASEIDVYLSV